MRSLDRPRPPRTADGRGVVIGSDGPGTIATGHIEGSAVVLASGLSVPCQLRFPVREADPDEPTDLDLLHWSHNVPQALIGRDGTMHALTQWATQGPAFSMAVLNGDLGAGKTRLAYELSEQLRREGWQAGVVPDPTQPVAFAHSDAGCLLVLDEWEDDPAALQAWLRDLQGAEAAGLRLRVLLLARACDRSELNPYVLDGWGPTALMPLLLHPLGDEDLWKLFQASHAAYAAQLRISAPLPVTRNGFSAWLRRHHSHPRPLPVQAYALHLVRSPEAQDRDPDQIVADMVRQEGARWMARWSALGMDDVAQGAWLMQVLAALTGSLPLDALQLPLPDEVLGGRMLPTPTQWRRVLGHDAVLQPLEPDWVAASALHMLVGAGTDEALLRACAPVLVHLVGGEHGPVQALAEHLRPLSRLPWCRFAWRPGQLDLWVRALIPLALRNDVVWRQALSARGVYLPPIMLALDEQQVQRLQAAVDAGDLAQRPVLAASLQALSADGSQTRDSPGWVQAAERACDIFSELARQDFVAHGGRFAQSLTNLSACRTSSDDHAGALHAIERAVQVYERLVQHDFAAYGPALAATLDENLLKLHGSLPTAKHAQFQRRLVALREQLVQLDLVTYGPALAQCLSDLANTVHDLDPKEKWRANQRRLDIFTQLARHDFAAYGSELADSLNAASFDLASSEGPDAQLHAIVQEVEVREQLTQHNLFMHGPGLAKALEFLSHRQHACDDDAACLATARRHVEIMEQLARTDATTHGAALANARSQLAWLSKWTMDADLTGTGPGTPPVSLPA